MMTEKVEPSSEEASENKTQPNKTEQNVPLERDERNDKDVSQGISQDIEALRSQGLSFQEIGEKLGMSKSKVFRMSRGRRQPDAAVPERIELEEPLEMGSIPNQPVQLMSDLDLNIEAKRLKKQNEILKLRANNSWLEFAAQNPHYMNRWNGNDGHGDGHDSESIKDLKLEIRELKQSLQNNPLGYMKLGVDAFKSGVDAVPKTQGIDPTTLFTTYRAGVQDARENLLATSHAQDNEYSVKREILQQEERLDSKRIAFEERKWEREEEKGDKTVHLIEEGLKAVTSGPIGNAISGLGEATRDRIRGTNPSMQDAQCPNCAHKFKANKLLSTIQCPNCGVTLQHVVAPEPTPQPENQPQTETPQPTEPEAQPQEPRELDPAWTPEERERWRKREREPKPDENLAENPQPR